MAGGNSTLRDALLPAVDTLRGIPGLLGMRLYTVAITKRTWGGTSIGLGANTDTSSGIKVDLGIFPVKVTQLSQRDIVASGGLYADQDIRVGPLTPPFAGSLVDNDAISVFDPPEGVFEELFFFVTGPGIPNGAWYGKISQDVSKSFRYTFVLRKSGRVP